LKKKNPLFSLPFSHNDAGMRKKITATVAFSKIYLNIVTHCKKAGMISSFCAAEWLF